MITTFRLKYFFYFLLLAQFSRLTAVNSFTHLNLDLIPVCLSHASFTGTIKLSEQSNKTINNYWMRLSMIWRIMQIEEGTPSSICIILQMIRKPNSIIVLLFVQNISREKMYFIELCNKFQGSKNKIFSL